MQRVYFPEVNAATVRVLAAFIHVIGLLPPDQIDLAGYALSVYKNASAQGQESDAKAKAFLDQAWQFRRVAGGYLIPIEFMGVWDTVASVIVPRQDKFLLDLQTLAYTRTNPSVKKFRQAMAIDERRRMFRLHARCEGVEFRVAARKHSRRRVESTHFDAAPEAAET